VPKVNAASDGAGPGRHGRGRRVTTSLSEINVVPMVDVMLVLLIIFMVAAPMIQRGLDVNLPTARGAQQMTGDRIEITVPMTYRQDRIVYLGREQVRAAVLQERVRQKMETAAKKEVFLGGDRGVNLGELMEVFSMLKAAGVEKVGIETKPGER
jgi:biopolymer transport protein TolR